MNCAADWLIGRWLEARFAFTMRLRSGRLAGSCPDFLLRLGMPVTAFFVAFNPIWGFTWYFNTESWATGIYQRLTELRVDPWRVAHDRRGHARLWRRRRRAVSHQSRRRGRPGDFSFLVVGDPGEGDASQFSLISRYLELGRRDDVKFLVRGLRRDLSRWLNQDYEANFYLPFQGFPSRSMRSPAITIGSTHWRHSTRIFSSPRRRVPQSKPASRPIFGLTSTNAAHRQAPDAGGAPARSIGVEAGTQRTPFFELQTDASRCWRSIPASCAPSMSDNGHGSSGRSTSRGKFIMAIVGHPRICRRP